MWSSCEDTVRSSPRYACVSQRWCGTESSLWYIQGLEVRIVRLTWPSTVLTLSSRRVWRNKGTNPLVQTSGKEIMLSDKMGEKGELYWCDRHHYILLKKFPQSHDQSHDWLAQKTSTDKTLITKQLMPQNQECSTGKTKQEDLGDKWGCYHKKWIFSGLALRCPSRSRSILWYQI